jgi:hypothetical protein
MTVEEGKTLEEEVAGVGWGREGTEEEGGERGVEVEGRVMVEEEVMVVEIVKLLW